MGNKAGGGHGGVNLNKIPEESSIILINLIRDN